MTYAFSDRTILQPIIGQMPETVESRRQETTLSAANRKMNTMLTQSHAYITPAGASTHPGLHQRVAN